MSLKRYREKRDFKATAEPKGTRTSAMKATGKSRLYVIQKHFASRLHYDLRLEAKGVLLSWAVPKGPSLDPKVKRLAVHVEDHPIEYGGFEGTIPKGNYGAGKVVLWDRGEWQPLEPVDAGFRKGKLLFEVNGEKLHGKFALVRMNDGDKNWLLIKEADKFARPESEYCVTDAEPRSVLSAVKKKRIGRQRETTDVDPAALLKKAASEKLPAFIAPQLATRVNEPPTGEHWLHEIKLDGYRLLARKDGSRVRLISRNELDWTARAKDIAEAVTALPATSALLDGEMVILDYGGTSSFQRLQNFHRKGEAGKPIFVAFDLLHLDGKNLRDLPLTERKTMLEELVRTLQSPILRYSTHAAGDGATAFATSCRHGLEGIISKRANARYISGRGSDWVKVKCDNRQEFIIVGYTPYSTDHRGVGALLLAVAEGKEVFTYAGKVGTGFRESDRRELFRMLEKMKIDRPAVTNPPPMKGAIWIEPTLVVEVAFRELTDEGLVRQGVFQGLREDKPADQVSRESVQSHTEDGPMNAVPKKRPAKPSALLELTHPDKLLFPDIGFTKADYARYLAEVAPAMLEEIAGRPISIVRCPGGVKTACFFQKHVNYSMPDVIKGVQIKVKDGSPQDYLLVESPEQLVALAQVSAVEIHAWNSHYKTLEKPDMFVIDLDPDSAVPAAEVVSSAKLVRDVLENLGLKSFVRVSGGKGLHVVVPLVPDFGWDEVKEFSRGIVELIERSHPGKYVTVMTKAKRKNKIFLDYLRNGRGATSIASYSLRARPGAPVAVPLRWEELRSNMRFDSFHPEDVVKRLRTGRNPWEGFYKTKQRITATMKKRLTAAVDSIEG